MITPAMTQQIIAAVTGTTLTGATATFTLDAPAIQCILNEFPLSSLRFPFTKETWTDGREIYPSVTVACPPPGTTFPTSFPHGIVGAQDLWIITAIASNGTERWVLPREDAIGRTEIHVDGANLIIAQSGHNWSGFNLDVFLEYTLT